MVMLEVEVVLRPDAFIVVVEDDEAEAGSGWDFCLYNGKKNTSLIWCCVLYILFAVISPQNLQI